MDWKKRRTCLAALLAALALGMNIVGCSGGNAAEPAAESEPTASEVQSAAVTETTTTTTTTAAETTTTESTTTTKKTTKKTAKKTTATKAPSDTTTQAAAETAATAAATKKAELSEDDKLANANYWLSYAKSYAESIGMTVDGGQDGGWEAPTPVESPKGTSWVKEDIEGKLDWYKSQGFSVVQIWITHNYQNEWKIIIAYVL